MTNINVASSAYTGCTQESLSVTALTNNQLSATGISYDASGNILGDGKNTYVWNAESEIKTGSGVNYTYDGDGDRVQKSNGKIYWYGAGTEILDESTASGTITDEYVYFGGKRIAHRVVSGNTISYYSEDFLGTSRAIATSAGTLCYDADFYPFGGERIVTNTCAQNYKFEGKERDTETNNDDFGARYYSSQFGRWLSPDWSSVPAPVPYANLTNPQTLNLYAMVSDNPETFADLDGHVGGMGGPVVLPSDESSCSMNGSGCSDEEAAYVSRLNRVTILAVVTGGTTEQDTLIAQILNFDLNVNAATNADFARGSSGDAVIDKYLHMQLPENQSFLQVYGREEDLHKADLKKAMDAYISNTSSGGELTSFLGRLSRVQNLYDKENATTNKIATALGWGASKPPLGSVLVSIARVLTPTPAKQELISYGVAAINKRMDALGAEP